MRYLSIHAVLAQDTALGLDRPLGSAYNLCSPEQAAGGEACYAVNLPDQVTPVLAMLYVLNESEWVLADPAGLRRPEQGSWEQLQPLLEGSTVLCAESSDRSHHDH